MLLIDAILIGLIATAVSKEKTAIAELAEPVPVRATDG